MASNHYLLDTHCLIWFQENNPKIPKKILDILQNTENVVYFSQISLFEISIKQSLGKLPNFSVSVEDIHNQALLDGFSFLVIENSAIFNYYSIPLLNEHRDPFDRLLISSAIQQNATLLSADEKFKLYPNILKLLWQ
ncbi:type II toxin-antitoxin system VapC family toxin [Pedobacter alluvionis]|uniref:PIN domain nuclease of toxin-antitoxin system n=1 Tax=Pedobacter alluvionis TaxID=475253 RepID=A0A497XYT4_9SPHI|nr:type II toxin-antitoxin system VapC family toxin [Pedobacter alluvionis]RLJ72665.1 PIN domain nuclease of toxin-antitoxin system [Pedobacter alluvionis]TFB29489.1 type II toxin-antitoxin system VapC family toxin [Pedobacter alluvionis]